MTRTKRTYKILLADSHTLFSRGLKTLLAGESDLEVVGEAGSLTEVLTTAKSTAPDGIVMDADMLGGSSEILAPELRQLAGAAGLLILTEQDTQENLDKAMNAGARGYMLKNSAPAQLIAGVRRIAQYDDHGNRGLSAFTSDLKNLAESNSYPRPSLLTLREQEVMRLLAEGRTVREVATELSLSIKTIEAHKLNLMRKLDIHNRTSLIECAVKMGLLTAEKTEVSS